jgi:hypothetical protein
MFVGQNEIMDLMSSIKKTKTVEVMTEYHKEFCGRWSSSLDQSTN